MTTPDTSPSEERWAEGASEKPPTKEDAAPSAPPSLLGTAGTSLHPRTPAISHPRRDPRDDLHLAELDVPGLSFISENGGVLQGQLAEAVYPGRKESNVSRRVHRWLRYKLVGVDRFLAMGCNQLWVTEKGADALLGAGYEHPERLFPRARPIPAKDLGHHMTIVDLVIVARRGNPFRADAIEPDWFLRRRMANPPVVPDLLLSATVVGSTARKLLAFEVDLGTESLKVFLPKLEKLSRALPEWSTGGPTAVTILTRGAGRAAAIEHGISKLTVPIMVKLLPKVTGRPSIAALAKLLSGGG